MTATNALEVHEQALRLCETLDPNQKRLSWYVFGTGNGSFEIAVVGIVGFWDVGVEGRGCRLEGEEGEEGKG